MEEAIRILVVDDEPDIRRICRILLETGGYTVLEAATGAEAVEQVRQHPELDLILMDIMMPELGGYDACSRIRSYSTAPVLFLTAKTQEGDKRRAYDSGGDDFLAKPFSHAELMMKVESLLRRYRVYKSKSSGRTLRPGEWLHYHRTFTPPAGEGGRVLLHFGAVDYACAVEVNGRLAGGHRGGYWPFTLDITDLLRPQGRNTLWVAVQDPTGTGTQARGKQTLRPGGMFYPAQSGIWQTVWMERVPENYIQSLTVTPDYDARTVTVKAHTSMPGGAVNLWAVVRAGGVTIAEDWGSDEADRDGEAEHPGGTFLSVEPGYPVFV